MKKRVLWLSLYLFSVQLALLGFAFDVHELWILALLNGLVICVSYFASQSRSEVEMKTSPMSRHTHTTRAHSSSDKNSSVTSSPAAIQQLDGLLPGFARHYGVVGSYVMSIIVICFTMIFDLSRWIVVAALIIRLCMIAIAVGYRRKTVLYRGKTAFMPKDFVQRGSFVVFTGLFVLLPWTIGTNILVASFVTLICMSSVIATSHMLIHASVWSLTMMRVYTVVALSACVIIVISVGTALSEARIVRTMSDYARYLPAGIVHNTQPHGLSGWIATLRPQTGMIVGSGTRILSGMSTSGMNVSGMNTIQTGIVGTGVVSTGVILATGAITTGTATTGTAPVGVVSTGATTPGAVSTGSVSTGASPTPSLPDADAIVSMRTAVRHLATTHKLPIAKTKPTFRFVARSDDDYEYFASARAKRMIGSDIQPDKSVMCKTYIVMKGIAAGRKVSYSNEPFDAYRAYAQKIGQLKGCSKNGFVKNENL